MSSKFQRLFVKSRLDTGAEIALGKDQAHYLGNVIRLKPGERLLLFNGEDGEWCAELSAIARKEAQVRIEHQTRPQDRGPDLHYLFAPLKRARLDYMAQKATEMGVRSQAAPSRAGRGGALICTLCPPPGGAPASIIWRKRRRKWGSARSV